MRKRYNLTIIISKENCKPTDGGYKLNADNIKLTESGYWLGRSDHWQMNKKDLEDLGLGSLMKITSKDIRNSDKADYNIISFKLIDKLIDYSWHSDINFSAIYDMFVQLKALDILEISCLNKFRKIIEEVPRDSMININYNHHFHSYSNITASTQDKVRDIFIQKIDKCIGKLSTNNSGRDMIIGNNLGPARKNDIQTFTDLISKKEKLILDTGMIDVIDEGLAIIENKEYERVEQMVTSTDRENRSLALEMLANCNVNKSFDVVSGLYYWHYDWLKDTNNWNTVNVKSFRTQMKRYEGGASNNSIYAYNNFINKLVEDGKLTKFAVDKTRKRLLDKFLNTTIGGAADVFTIKLEHLHLKEEFKEKIINENNESLSSTGSPFFHHKIKNNK